MGNKITDRSATPTEVSSPPPLATAGEDDCPSVADDDQNKSTFFFMGLFLDTLPTLSHRPVAEPLWLFEKHAPA